MSEWKEVKLGDLVTIKYGKDHKSLSDGVFPVFGSGGLMRKVDSYIYDKPSLLIPRKGTLNNIIYTEEKFWTVDTMFWTKVDELKTSAKFLYYYLKDFNFNAFNVGSAVPSLTVPVLNDIDIKLPSTDKQSDIVGILSSLDAKIETNNKLNEKLEEMAQAIFKSWFVDFEPFKDKPFHETELGMIPEGWEVHAASDMYNINIGKTPPRKEPIWFSENQNDVKWISISDLGKSGTFIIDSSEKLTKEAIKKHNIIVVPKNTILLSFKLTIGRVAICNSDMTTNEAIARFYLNDEFDMEYLYMYLKNYNYELLGSTSSIATAVNSKIIKNMYILKPPFEVVKRFHSIVNPLFERIRRNIEENNRLASLRDTLLPRLMSGEIKV